MPYDPSFYEDRLAKAKDPRSAVWDGTPEQWERCKRETKEILKEHITPGMSVLDVGCGIGELVECLPHGCGYLGLDYCDGFINEARRRYPTMFFECCDITKVFPHPSFCMDIAVCRTVEGVMCESVWPSVIESLLMCVPKILVFRAMLADGEMAKTVKVITR